MVSLLNNLYGKVDRLIVRIINRIRIIRLRMQGAKLGKNVRAFGRFIVIGDARNLTIGEGTTINEGVLFNLRDTVSVGQSVHISSYVQLHTAWLNINSYDRPHESAPIVIEDFCWLASGVVVGAGVRVGKGTVVSANAVVIENLPENVFATGLPARPLHLLSDRNVERQ